MADDEDEPTVTLGADRAVEGAPLARVSARLMWGIEKSAIVEREGETTIRTPEGPRELADLLDGVDKTYFGTRQEFEAAVEDVLDDGPIPVGSGGDEAETDDPEAAKSEQDGEPANADDEQTEAGEQEHQEGEGSDAEETATGETSNGES